MLIDVDYGQAYRYYCVAALSDLPGQDGPRTSVFKAGIGRIEHGPENSAFDADAFIAEVFYYFLAALSDAPDQDGPRTSVFQAGIEYSPENSAFKAGGAHGRGPVPGHIGPSEGPIIGDDDVSSHFASRQVGPEPPRGITEESLESVEFVNSDEEEPIEWSKESRRGMWRP